MESSYESNIFQKNDEGTFLYIRHGQTLFNKYSEEFGEPEAKLKIEFIDCQISELGITQSELLSDNIKNLKITEVYCSPMLRCLETCLISLKNHPQKESIKVIIHPWITEMVHCIHDYSKNMAGKKEKFSKNQTGIDFDWSLFESLFPSDKEQENYFLQYVDNLPDEDNKYAKSLADEIAQIPTVTEERDQLLLEFSYFCTRHGKIPETLKHMFKRNLNFKEYLRSKFPNPTDNSEKILVYTHSSFIQLSDSKEAYLFDTIDNYPKDSYKPKNCEIISMNIYYNYNK